jgi:1-deoxy-D-xylulose-5-phosphate reductoisomerase
MTLRVAILGSTGSIGRQALEVAERERERMAVVGLAAGRDLEGLARQAARVRPAAIALETAADPVAARRALSEASPAADVEVGPGASARLVARVAADAVLNAIVGAAGLRASLATLDRGLTLALANKETLVVGGPLVAERLARGGRLVPVDSEHSAALQAMGGRPAAEIAALVLTASGGALRRHPDWRRATPAEVLAHPVWSMGPRITVDSATLFNKGLELIEARWLFGLEWGALEAWLHPQAVVHAIVTFRDGSSVLQAASPDMRLPIQLALSWPARWGAAVRALSPDQLQGLTFEPIRSGRFPALDAALAAGRAGGTAPCALNAADEVAVAAFLEGQVPLSGVPDILKRVLDAHEVEDVTSVEQLERVDAWARAFARAEAVNA